MLSFSDLTIYSRGRRGRSTSTLSYLKFTVVLHTIANFWTYSRSFPVKPNDIRFSHSHQDLVYHCWFVAALDTAVIRTRDGNTATFDNMMVKGGRRLFFTESKWSIASIYCKRSTRLCSAKRKIERRHFGVHVHYARDRLGDLRQHTLGGTPARDAGHAFLTELRHARSRSRQARSFPGRSTWQLCCATQRKRI